jgi:hypothetical protein
MKRRPVLWVILGLLLAGVAQAETWRFALIGDTPYSDYERQQLPLMLRDIAEQHPAFIVHAGDFKSGATRCSDDVFLNRRALFDASTVPLIYVPGDNEWTDCSRLSAGQFDPLERLSKLREIFFDTARSLGTNKRPLERQPGNYPEHQRWPLGPVLFVTLNVPGGNNNHGVGDDPGAEFLARNPLVIDWLKQGFAQARRDKLEGIVIVMQANPGFKHFAAGLAHNGYRELLTTLRDETLTFKGEVLLVHGDTHWQRVDQPLRHPETKLPLANFTRAETFGYPIMGWVKVIIDDRDPQLFRFEVHLHK